MSKSQIHPIFMIVVLVIFIVIFAIGGIILFKVSDSINTEIQGDSDLSAQSKQVYGDFNNNYPTIIDGGFLFLFMGLWFALLVGAYFVRDHPLIFLLLFFFMGFLIYGGAMLSNFYQEFASDSEMIAYSSQLPYISFIMGHLVEFIIGLFVTIGLAMMIKQFQTQ